MIIKNWNNKQLQKYLVSLTAIKKDLSYLKEILTKKEYEELRECSIRNFKDKINNLDFEKEKSEQKLRKVKKVGNSWFVKLEPSDVRDWKLDNESIVKISK